MNISFGKKIPIVKCQIVNAKTNGLFKLLK